MWLLATVLGLVVWLLWRYSHFWRAGLPYLTPWPVVGNMGPIALQMTPFHDLARAFYQGLAPHRCGGMFTFTTPVLLVRDHELIGQLFTKEFDHFSDRQELIPEAADPLFAKSLFGLQGQRWREMRHILSPAFTPNKIKNMIPLIKEIGQQMKDYLSNEMKQTGNTTHSVAFEVKDFFSKITNDVIASTAFGVRVNTLEQPNNQFYTMGKEITDFGRRKSCIIFGYLLFPTVMQYFGIKFMRDECYNFFTSMILEAIAERERCSIVRQDMIELLMQASRGRLDIDFTDSSREKHSPLNKIDLAAQAMIFLFGGLDTVSSLLSFTSYILAMHQEVQQKLTDEIDDLILKKGYKFTYEDISACRYIDMVISESLRLYPPFAVMARKCVATHTVPRSDAGAPAIHVEPGDILWFSIIGLHTDPELFPDPERFDPERFSEERKKFIKPFSYVPFGVGPRLCIANRFALMEAKVLLVYLLSQFSIAPTARTPAHLRLTASGFSPTVDGGLWLAVRQRSISSNASASSEKS